MSVITFDPWTFFLPAVVAAIWAYRIHTKTGSGDTKFVVAVVLAITFFGLTILVVGPG